MSLFVTEIFHSIQGESILMGRPCVFIRLSGCNLRCTYCDTQYAYENGTELALSTIIQKVSQYHCNLVEITGGEPLIQPDTPELISQLIAKGHEVMLETNGSLDISGINYRCIKVMDIKCPSSNETDKNNFKNIEYLTQKDQIKFVIGSREDFKYAKSIISEFRPDLPDDHILFSPVFNQMPYDTLAKWILEDSSTGRLQVQIHKLIWPGKDRGV